MLHADSMKLKLNILHVFCTQKEPHHWKLGLSRDRGHIGQVHWSKFGSNLMKYMVRFYKPLCCKIANLKQILEDLKANSSL